MNLKIIGIIGITYIILTSICCKFMAIIFYYPLNFFNKVQIVYSPMKKPIELSHGITAHVYLLVNGEPYEPRFLGLMLKKSIDYDVILARYNSPTEFMNEHNLIPFMI